MTISSIKNILEYCLPVYGKSKDFCKNPRKSFAKKKYLLWDFCENFSNGLLEKTMDFCEKTYKDSCEICDILMFTCVYQYIRLKIHPCGLNDHNTTCSC